MLPIKFVWLCVLVLDLSNFWVEMRKLKHILIWTHPGLDPISPLGMGRDTFLKRKCGVNNCFVTSNRKFFNDITNFDLVLFHGPEILLTDMKYPYKRSPRQIYLFACMESPANFPARNENLNGFFNWTWTYKLKSDIIFGYIIIKNALGHIIGPKENMRWVKVDDMIPNDEEMKDKLKDKSIAAAWFVSNCRAANNRRNIAIQIKHELRKYGLNLHIYGRCGQKSCIKESECAEVIQKYYYFYLAFENSFGEDYVTEKLLRPLNHYTVPVVYGGADYTRFMPDGIYLDARTLSIEELVKKMVYLIDNKEEYYKYFRWHSYYSYHEPTEFPETDPYCNLCAALNDKTRVKNVQVYDNFYSWWNKKGPWGQL